MYCNTSTLTISIRVLHKMRRARKKLQSISIYLSRKYAFFSDHSDYFCYFINGCCVIIDNIKLSLEDYFFENEAVIQNNCIKHL